MSTIDTLQPLIGTWVGEGTADYPTIDRVTYLEQLTILPEKGGTLLHYDQQTWYSDSGAALHHESGFFRPLDADQIELVNAQNNGRVEVLKGTVLLENGRITLRLDSAAFANDPRMVQSRRVFVLDADTLRYHQSMATQITPEMQTHLVSTLNRQM